MKPQVVLIRHKQTNHYSIGNCIIIDAKGNNAGWFKSLERGWRDNKRNVSCLPPGKHFMVKEYSPRFKKDLWEIYGVPNRAECKFHAANFWFQLNGCIALGLNHADINGDGDPDVTNSKKAMKQFEAVLDSFNCKRIEIIVA